MNWFSQIQFSSAIREKQNSEPPRLGEFLIETGIITQPQLEKALERQKENAQKGQQVLVGQVLIELGYFDRDTLEQATAKYMLSQRAALQAAQESDKSKERMSIRLFAPSVERLDALMNLVGELITDRNGLNQLRNNWK